LISEITIGLSLDRTFLFYFSLYISAFRHQDKKKSDGTIAWLKYKSWSNHTVCCIGSLFLSKHVDMFSRLWKQPFAHLNYRGPYFGVCLFQANKPSWVVLMLSSVRQWFMLNGFVKWQNFIS